MATLVFSYSHADEALRNELETHLSPLKRMGTISAWHDRRIAPGQEFEHEIDRYFAEANIILLLVSSDFIASDYCWNIEIKNAMVRHERGEAIVIPVILRNCTWHNLPFGKLLAATKDGKPITQFPSHDDGFVQVVDAVSKAAARIDTNNSTQVPHASTSSKAQLSPSVNTVLQPRSGNLSLPKTFSDLDKDRASREGFEYVARYFENSLFELKQRNPGIEVEFQSVDSSAFTCAIYLHGTRTGQCGVWRGDRLHGVGSVCFSHDGMVRNSYNESLSLADNGQSLGFRTMMEFSGNSHNTLLTNEGMAEHLWDMFFKSVKQRMS